MWSIHLSGLCYDALTLQTFYENCFPLICIHGPFCSMRGWMLLIPGAWPRFFPLLLYPWGLLWNIMCFGWCGSDRRPGSISAVMPVQRCPVRRHHQCSHWHVNHSLARRKIASGLLIGCCLTRGRLERGECPLLYGAGAAPASIDGCTQTHMVLVPLRIAKAVRMTQKREPLFTINSHYTSLCSIIIADFWHFSFNIPRLIN